MSEIERLRPAPPQEKARTRATTQGKRGVLIYWTVDVAGRWPSTASPISCSASEVTRWSKARCATARTWSIEQNFVDSHGVSFVGFGITRLLDFDLIARFKQINTMKLYAPGRATWTPTPCSRPPTRPIRWDVIENNTTRW